MYIKHNGKRYFFYSRDGEERIALTSSELGTTVYRINDGGELEFEEEMLTDEFEKRGIEAENIYEDNQIMVLPVDEEGNLVFSSTAGNTEIECRCIRFNGEDIFYLPRVANFGWDTGYPDITLAEPNSFFRYISSLREVFLDEFHRKNKKAEENNAEIRKIWKNLSKKFPELDLENSLLGTTKAGFESGAVIPENMAMDMVLAHRFVYELKEKYRELVDSGFGNAASAALKKQGGEWRVDEPLLNAVYTNLKGKKIKMNIEKEKDDEMSLGLKFLLNGQPKWFTDSFQKAVGCRVNDYFVWESLRKLMPKSITDMNLLQRMNSIRQGAALHMLLYSAAKLTKSVQNIAEVDGPERLLEVYEEVKAPTLRCQTVCEYQKWMELGEKAGQKLREKRRKNVLETYAVDDFRKKCLIPEEINEDLMILPVKDAGEFSEDEFELVMERKSILHDEEMMFFVWNRYNTDARAFIVLNLKTRVVEFLDTSPDAEKIISKEMVQMDEDVRKFFESNLNRLHNLYLVNHDVI